MPRSFTLYDKAGSTVLAKNVDIDELVEVIYGYYSDFMGEGMLQRFVDSIISGDGLDEWQKFLAIELRES